jgi:hypothetical protein
VAARLLHATPPLAMREPTSKTSKKCVDQVDHFFLFMFLQTMSCTDWFDFFLTDLFNRLVFSNFLPLSSCFNNTQWERGMVEFGISGRNWPLVLSRAGEEEITVIKVVLLLV